MLTLKGNQVTLVEEADETFIDADAKEYEGTISEVVEITETGHGRREIRRYRALASLEGSNGAPQNTIQPSSASKTSA